MKTKKLALCAATLALAGGMLVGCKNKEEDAKLSKVSFSGISSTYKSDETIAWGSLVITFSYSDNSAVSFTSDKMEFDVDTPVKSETELLVKTDGLYASVAPHEEGRYFIKAALKEDFTKFYDVGSIAVGLISKDKYSLVEYALPRNITDLQSVVKDAGKDEEGAFTKFNDDFTVGTANPWKFEPVATFAEKANLENVDDFTNYEKEEKLYVVDGASETEVSQAAYKRIVLGGGKYQFAEEDAGKRFKIVVSPKEFSKDAMGDNVKPVSFTFNVMEGYNVYTAKELGVLNLTNLKSEEFYGDHAYCEHYRVATPERGESRNAQSDVFIIKPGEANPYGNIDLPRVWEKFLLDNGVLTSETVAAARDVKGVFMQNDIKILSSDIPSEYFINDFDLVNHTLGGINTGALRDDTSIYAPTTMNELTISGNYFKLDASSIPLCKNTTDGSTCDALGGYPIVSFTKNWDKQIMPGHANLFKICGVSPEESEPFYKAQKYADTVKPAIFKNMRTVGNTGSDIGGAEGDLDKKMKVTGLIFGKETRSPVTFDNLIIQEYQIGLFGDNGIGHAVPENNIPQTNYTFLKNTKIFDCANSGIFNYKDGGVHVSNTVMKRFGGACIINAGDADQSFRQSNTTFTPDCVFENYITGGEVYFAAVGASGYIAQIQAFNEYFKMSSKCLIGPDGTPNAGKMNLVALQMDGDGYVLADNGKYYGDLVMNAGSEKEIKVSLGSEHEKLAPLSALCKTESDSAFVMPSDPSSPYAEAAGYACYQMTGDLLDMDISLGKTYLSCVFDLFDKVSA